MGWDGLLLYPTLDIRPTYTITHGGIWREQDRPRCCRLRFSLGIYVHHYPRRIAFRPLRQEIAVLFGIFGFSLLPLSVGLATGTHQIFIVRFFTGMVEAFYFIPLIALTLELFPERPGFYVTFMSSGSSLGWFTGPASRGIAS